MKLKKLMKLKNKVNSMSINIERFGKDHWSLLSYVEYICVNGCKGVGCIQRNKMRCNTSKHPLLSTGIDWRDSYSTRLSGFFEYPFNADLEKSCATGFQVLGHDDWDCLDDLNDAGLIEIISLTNCFVKMTEKGLDVSSKLTYHRTKGGNLSNFKILSD